MCKILYFSGNKNQIKLAFDFVDALVDASSNDPTYPKGATQHKDGFGYAIVGLTENKPNIHFFKSIKPIFKAGEEISQLKEVIKGLDYFSLSLHSRKVLEGSANIFNTHPYFFSSVKGFSFFLSHNGTLDKSKLQSLLEVNNMDNLSDTFLLGLIIEKNLNAIDSESVIPLFKEFTQYIESALNTITLFSDAQTDKTKVLLTNYYKKTPDYYKVYILRAPGLFAFTSSGVYHYIQERGIAQMEPLKNKSAFFIEDAFLQDTREVSLE